MANLTAMTAAIAVMTVTTMKIVTARMNSTPEITVTVMTTITAATTE